MTARLGVAYDVFGNGKTAVKFNMGKYMEAFVASNSDFDLNPLDPHDHQHDAVVDRLEQGFRAELRSVESREERRMRGDGR